MNEPSRAGKRVLLRGLWLLIVGPAVLGLAGELACALELRTERQSAEAFQLRSPNIFVAPGIREAGHKSLWTKPGWEYRPGARFEKEVGNERYVVQINSHGFRTHEFREKKPPGTVRVICVGGSTTVQGRTNEDTYPALLEKRLQGQYPSCSLEVLNFGISATNSERWLADSDGLFRYEPDLVVQYDGVNDIMGRALPHYAREHPWREALSRSLLLERLFPLAPQDLDPELERIVDNLTALRGLSRIHDAEHVCASFAAPDYARASPDERAYLDVSVGDGWTPWPGTIHLKRYAHYARILDRYNMLFEDAVRRGRLDGVMVHRSLSDPDLFVDICHMRQSGIARLAEILSGPVSAIVGARCSSAETLKR
jgi:hypothetical protein